MRFRDIRCTDLTLGFELFTQLLVDVIHLIEVITTKVINPLHDLLGTKRFLTQFFGKKRAQTLAVKIE
ncbi:Uncharacterised protein [Vibrio cholerae]|nr:Uncharacterised protein [Vibrio cholerae]